MILANQLTTLRAPSSRRRLAVTAGVDRRSIAALEAGDGNLDTLNRVAASLHHYLSPHPRALANKRRWLGVGTRTLASAAGITRPTLVTLESTGSARVCSYESVCKALNETPRLLPVITPWYTPRPLLDAMLTGLGIDQFDLDPASPDAPTVPCTRHYSEVDGGLWLPWEGRTIWCNPPYDDVPSWTAKAINEFGSGRAQRLLFLVPLRPETNNHRRIMASGARVIVLDKRIAFGGRSSTLSTPSMLVCWGLSDVEFRALAAALPPNHELHMRRAATMVQEPAY